MTHSHFLFDNELDVRGSHEKNPVELLITASKMFHRTFLPEANAIKDDNKISSLAFSSIKVSRILTKFDNFSMKF